MGYIEDRIASMAAAAEQALEHRRNAEARSVRAFTFRYRQDARAGRVPKDAEIEAACLARYLSERPNWPELGAMKAYAAAVRAELGDPTISFPSMTRCSVRACAHDAVYWGETEDGFCALHWPGRVTPLRPPDWD